MQILQFEGEHDTEESYDKECKRNHINGVDSSDRRLPQDNKREMCIRDSYINDKVINVDIFEKSNEVFEGIDPTLIDRIYSSKEGLDLSLIHI